MFSRVSPWLPAIVVVLTTLIYVWLLTGAPGRWLVAGTPTDLPPRERAYPGRERLGAIDPMGVKPEVTAPGAPAAPAELPGDGAGGR
ncbi:MAG: hypothetical protein PVF51_07150 [Nitrospirota bacterium]|jgi:hypothetical protein